MQTAVEWARENGRPFRWNTLLTNYEPPRMDYAYGDGWFYDREDVDYGVECVVLDGTSEIKEPHKATYLVDDGVTVQPYYVASYHAEDLSYVVLHPFPVNVNTDGSPRLREGDLRPINFSNWQVGPRRAYHVKITRK